VARARLEAAIFDMDGLLVDSEPLWHEAEIEVLGALGVPIDVDGCRETKGMFVNDVIADWRARYPWEGETPEEVGVRVVDAVMALVAEKGVMLPGVEAAIARCREHKLRLAVASSSQYRLIDFTLGHFGLRDAFEVVHSAEDERQGKPNPAVFLTTATKLGVDPRRCLVFEDSPAGVATARAAGMLCIAVPAPEESDQAGIANASVVLKTLDLFDDALLESLAASIDET
jgi:HAD superfamily hydrolase (TIGR01509 family)